FGFVLEAAGMTSRSSGGDGGAAVAQPGAPWRRVDAACLVGFGLVTLGLFLWARSAVLAASGGVWGAPLDDSYIHFQFARSFARFRPFEYAPGQGRVPGATSLLWPALLTPAIWLGASASGLIKLTWVLSFGALFGQASEVYLASRRFLSRPVAWAAGLLVLTFSANTWFAASAMEVVPLGYVLLRSARRAAEYWEGQDGVGRRRELVLLAFVAALLRPEGALVALAVAVVLARRERKLALVALLAPLSVPSLNWLFSGSAAQTTTLAKWLPANPYYQGRLLAAVLGNVELFFGTLLDGRQWSWTFIPEGYWLVGLACLPALWLAAERRRARAHAALLIWVGLGILLPATYETFLVNRLRYLWPFSAPWLLGLAALGELLVWPLAQRWPRLVGLGLVVPALAGYGFAKLAPISVHDVAESAAAITEQQVALGKWAAAELPKSAKIGVNDAGAIAFFSERPTFDVVGLTTRGEARYWVAGAGSRFEHYERLDRSALPTHFIVYPEWFGLPSLLGDCLTERRVEGATILGGPLMVACHADYASLGSGAKPTIDSGSRRLLDELDVADLESEAAHRYWLGAASAPDDVIESADGRVDGGRARRTYETFQLTIEPDGSLVVRLSADVATRLEPFVADQPLPIVDLAPQRFQEIVVPLPARAPRGANQLTLRSNQPITLLHYWSFSRVL
ncbi:MAG TPA: hypothetical protein VEQ59_06255, partial [Polyangiaceae bacterium]|nr:hypothetical protein [Polyangiaceae bacterium]